METMKGMQPHQIHLLVLTLAVMYEKRDQKQYQSLEHWFLQNCEQPKFHLKQRLN